MVFGKNRRVTINARPSVLARPTNRTRPTRRASRTAGRIRSRTRTATKTKLNQKIRTSKDGPVSDSYFSHKMKGGFKSPLLKHIGGQLSYVVNKGLQTTYSGGLQNGYGIIQWYGGADLEAHFSNYTNSANTGATAVNTAKLFLKNVKGELLLTNQGNDLCHMTIYDCVSRRDQYNGSSTSDPWSAWSVGCNDASSANTNTYVGAHPFVIPGFTELFKVLKVTQVDLHTGGHHRHMVKISPNRVFSREILTNVVGTTGISAIAKLTHFSMIVMHGYPTNATGGTTVSTSHGAIDWVQTREYKFQGLTFNRSVESTSNTLTTLATESIINDLTGIVATVVTA